MLSVQAAERAGVDIFGRPRPTEDRISVLDNAVVLLDGATATSPARTSVTTYVDTLLAALCIKLTAAPNADLVIVLGDGIATTAANLGLRPGDSPSSTVAILRWTDQTVDALVLADSPIVVFTDSGPEVLADDRLRSLRAQGALRTTDDVNALRNTPGGFWVAEAEPAAAEHARRGSWPTEAVRAALLASDGVSTGVDDYRILDWMDVLEFSTTYGPNSVLDAVRAAERGDAGRVRWPRWKVHDDQALAVVAVEHCRAGCQSVARRAVHPPPTPLP